MWFSVTLNLTSVLSNSRAPLASLCARNTLRTLASFSTFGFNFLHKDGSTQAFKSIPTFNHQSLLYIPKLSATVSPFSSCWACSYSISQLDRIIVLPNHTSVTLYDLSRVQRTETGARSQISKRDIEVLGLLFKLYLHSDRRFHVRNRPSRWALMVTYRIFCPPDKL